jgi:hypothetical protein
MERPPLAPAVAYENLQNAALDYLEHFCQLFRAMKRPDSESLSWNDVHTMADLVSTLAEAAKLIATIETKPQ